MTQLRLDTTLEKAGPAAAIVLSDEQVAQLGPAKNPPVQVTIGANTVRVRVARMGGKNLIGFNKALREQLGIEAGDTVSAVIALDEQERTVDVPQELRAALDTAGALPTFETWSYTRRKEAARSVTDAKRDDTRQRRIEKIVAEAAG